ncbi:MAG: hypothetical protein M3Q45_04915 [Chloroflexota bacterium]|nr:hypothetical protein [Chloroflexota bacterium]
MSDNFLSHDPVTESREDHGQGRQLHDNEPTGDVAPESLAKDHEVEDVSVRALLRFVGGLAVALVVVMFALWWLLEGWTRQDSALDAQIPSVLATEPEVPGPGVEAYPMGELNALYAEDQERLQTYGWVDQAAGQVHVPIERAKAMLIESDAPSRRGDPPVFGLDPAYELESEGGQNFAGEFMVGTSDGEE